MAGKGVSPSSCCRHATHVAWRDVGGEVLIIHPGQSTMVPLDRVGSRIWTLLDGSRDAAAVAAEVCEAFEVEKERALKDVLVFLGKLEKEGLIEAVAG
jgi:hypothetical protein